MEEEEKEEEEGNLKRADRKEIKKKKFKLIKVRVEFTVRLRPKGKSVLGEGSQLVARGVTVSQGGRKEEKERERERWAAVRVIRVRYGTDLMQRAR